jgi:hypothetical protein
MARQRLPPERPLPFAITEKAFPSIPKFLKFLPIKIFNHVE